MDAQVFSMNEAIRFGWEKMKSRIGFFIGLLIVMTIVYTVPDIISGVVGRYSLAAAAVINIISSCIEVLMQIGLVVISLKFCREIQAKVSDLFTHYELFIKYAISALLYGLIVFGGFILLIIPGIIWGVKFQFFGYLIVDKGYGPIEALKASAKITYGYKMDLFLFNILIAIINLLGFICLFIGLFATIPTTIIAMAHVYTKLSENLEVKAQSDLG